MDMAKYKTELLNELAEKKPKERDRKPVTMYLHRQNFESFKKLIKPLSPSEVFDKYIFDTLNVEKKKK